MGNKKYRLNNIYFNMKDRCNNPNHPSYKNYGGRGITVCSEWNDSWKSFRDWSLSNGYSENLSLDRIDNSKGYNPDNCRWVSMRTQANNRRNNHYVTYNGETKSISDWARELGINKHTLVYRLNVCKYSVEKAFQKKDIRLRMIDYKGRTQSLASWCRELELNYETVLKRLDKYKWSLERAFETK